MPLVELLACALAAGCVAALVLVVLTAHRSRRALATFKKLSRGMPMHDDGHWLYNHAFYPIKRDINFVCLEAHKAKGDTVGLLYRQQFMASTVDLDLIKLINQDECQSHVDKLRCDLPMEEFEQSIVAVGGDDWRQTRRVFAPALRPHKFMTPVVLGEVRESIDKLVAHIERRLSSSSSSSGPPAGVVLDIDETSHRFSMDLVLRCFYRQRDQIDFDAKQCEWTDTMHLGFKEMQTSLVFKLAIVFPVLVPLVDWLMWHFAPMGKWRRTIMRFVEEQTRRGIELRRRAAKLNNNNSEKQKKLTQTPFERNLFDYILDKFLEGKLTRRQYLNSSCFLLPAADKTAADAIGHTLYQLASNPEVQQRARQSVRQAAGWGPDSQYLAWVIHESLRLFTPASSGCGRIITRDIATKEGHLLPAGTFVATPAMAIHRLERYWGADAGEFRPERWRDTSHHHPFQYLAFGGGLRVCPGREFALFQMKMLLGELLVRYSFECQPNPDIYHFDCPYFQTSLPYAPTYVTVRRLAANLEAEAEKTLAGAGE